MRPLVSHILVGVVAAAVVAGITVAIMYSTLPLCDEDDNPTVAPTRVPTRVTTAAPASTAAPTTPAPHVSDPLRPAYHYTPAFGWVNDPNGLVYYKGEFHLFYQHDYETTHHGNMSWGHAISTDLVHWTEMSEAIPYTLDEQIFSGSAVVDWTCSSGLCAEPGLPVLIATYTSFNQHEETSGKWKGRHIQSQHIASSTDLGRTWIKYPKNPVLDQHEAEFRDPKVQRIGDEWLMLVQMSEEHVLHFYKSKDLINWGSKPVSTFGPVGEIGGVWECPDLFQLPVDGDPNNKKWVLIVNINPGNRVAGSAGQFFLGDFDGTTFKNERETEWLDWGMDNYATVTWDNAPNGERISIGWMSNWNYTELAPVGPSNRNAFTSPRKLQLKTIDGKVRLTQMPVSYLDAIRRGPVQQADRVTLKEATHGSDALRGRAADINVVFTNVDAKEFGVRVHAGDGQETLVGFDVDKKEAFVDRTNSGTVDFHPLFPGRHSGPFTLEGGNTLRLRILVDHGSVEAFFGQGEMAITDVVFPDPTKDKIEFYAKGGSVVIENYDVWQMAKTNNLS